MLENIRRVSQIASVTLNGLDSYLSSSMPSIDINAREMLKEFSALLRTETGRNERLIGVYINDMTNYMLLTDLGVHVFDLNKRSFFAYAEIETLTPFVAEDEDLDFQLRSGNCVSLPILNATDGVKDIQRVHQFFAWIHSDENEPTLHIDEIDNVEKLTTWLRQPSEWRAYLVQLADFLEREESLNAWLEELELDPKLLKNTSVLKLIAALLEFPRSRTLN